MSNSLVGRVYRTGRSHRNIKLLSSNCFGRNRYSSSSTRFVADYRVPIANTSTTSLFTRSFISTTTTQQQQQQQQQPVTLYNSLTGSFEPIPLNSSSSDDNDDRILAWYVCGPTTYAPAHLGHARTYVWMDILRRILEDATEDPGKLPLFIMNITDVDDKILAAAAATTDAEDPISLARRFEAEFWRDMDALGCKRPHIVTRVTEHVESDIVPYIQTILRNGMAYESPDGVYFDVKALEDQLGTETRYGLLAPNASSGSSPSDDTTANKKRDPRDFVLWKLKKEGESLSWSSPWGEGRPGWHIECSAMIESIQKQLHETHAVKVHAGGVDLKFPHHTNEIAQAQAYHGREHWIDHWVHTGHLHIDGHKMSKSLKNFITIEELLKNDVVDDEGESVYVSFLSSPADDFRLWCLGMSGSYRGPTTFSKDAMQQASNVRQKLVKFLLEGERWKEQSDNDPSFRVKKWRRQDFELFETVKRLSKECTDALRGSAGGTRSFDVDGGKFLDGLIAMAEAGTSYMVNGGDAPIAPLDFALATLRRNLELVGFTPRTTHIGLSTARQSETTASSSSSNIVGGESRLADEMVAFRYAVRSAALDALRQKDAVATDAVLQEILQMCDTVRDETLPSIGLELIDGKVDGDESSSASSWRYCLPESFSGSEIEADDKNKEEDAIDIHSVPLVDFFRVGQHDGMFGSYDEDGIPLTMADGSLVSARLTKKLLKKRSKHEQRLESNRQDYGN